MKTIEFDLGEHEFIELNRLLKFLSLVNSGGDAKMVIANGEVLVNGEVELRTRNKIKSGFTVQFNDQTIHVK